MNLHLSFCLLRGLAGAWLLAVLPGLAAPVPGPAEFSAKPGYPFIIADYEQNRVVEYNADGVPTWVYEGQVKPLDAWAMPDGSVLMTYLPSPLTKNLGGVRGVGADQKTLFDIPLDDEIFAVQPLDNGNFLVGECHFARISEMDRTGKRIRSFQIRSKPSGHTTMRQLRLTPQGTILVGEAYNHKIREYDFAGTLLKEQDLRFAHYPLPLPDGHILTACWNAPEAQVVETDAAGKVVWNLKPADLPKGMDVTHIAGTIRLANGNTLVTVSCKPGGGTGPRPMLFEITPEKKVVWQLVDKTSASLATGVKLIPSWTPGGQKLPPPPPPPKNLALLAKITADSEYSRDWGPEYVADGQVPAMNEGEDSHRGWAVQGRTHLQGSVLAMEWPAPVTVAEVVYYGRTVSNRLGNCWNQVELVADGQPLQKFALKKMHGPQRLTLAAPASVQKLEFRFAGSDGNDNPGAAEIQVFAAPARFSDLVLTPPYPPEYLQQLIAEKQELRALSPLLAQAKAGALSPELLELAGNWLEHPDPFVQALAEWTIASQVGQENDQGAAVWPKAENPAWFQRYLAVPAVRRVEYDMIRHAFARGLLEDPAKLRADLAEMAGRAAKVAPRAAPERQAAATAALAALQAVVKQAEPAGLGAAELRPLWLEARRQARTIALAQPELPDSIFCTTRFALHHKPNVCGIHYPWAYKPGGDLCLLSGTRSGTPAVKPLLNGQLGAGHVHGADLWFDADRIVFAWASQPNWPPKDAKGNPVNLSHQQNNYAYELSKLTEPLHLYEFDLKTGKATQLTRHHFFNDLEPCYLPDGAIAFTSDRSAHSPACDGWENDITDTNLYKLLPDRQKIRRITNQKDVDMHPHLLNDGRIGYLRWEYTETAFWPIHSFWVVNPDGTMADALYKQHFTDYISIREVRPIPNSTKFVGIAGAHHAQAIGPLVRINPAKGINEPAGTEVVALGSGPYEGGQPKLRVPEGGVPETPGYYYTPCGLSEEAFLVSFGFGATTRRCYGRYDLISNDAGLYFVDVFGDKELLYRDPLLCVVGAMPLAPRPKPTITPDRYDTAKNYATCSAVNVYDGTEIPKGTVKAIRIMESLPWPVTEAEGARYFGGSSFGWQISQETCWGPVRVIGTVPVEADGSAYFKVPVMTNASVYFQALDENGMEIQRMRSSISFAPGETRSCLGCHETRGNVAPTSAASLAMKREPSVPVPPPWGTAPISFEKQVQPILDRRCISCHSGNRPAGGLSLSGQQKVTFGLDEMNESYFNLRKKKLLVCTDQNITSGAVTKPRQFGSYPSKFTRILVDNEKHRKLPLTAEERQTLFTWVDANCPYHDQVVDKRSGLVPPKPAEIVPQALTHKTGHAVREDFPWHDPWAMPVEAPAFEAK